MKRGSHTIEAAITATLIMLLTMLIVYAFMLMLQKTALAAAAVQYAEALCEVDSDYERKVLNTNIEAFLKGKEKVFESASRTKLQSKEIEVSVSQSYRSPILSQVLSSRQKEGVNIKIKVKASATDPVCLIRNTDLILEYSKKITEVFNK